MDHHGFMTGMLLGGALVAAVPTALLVWGAVLLLRAWRSERARGDPHARTEEV